MSEFLPPIVMELRGRATQLFTTLSGVEKGVTKMEATTDVAATRMEHRLSVMSGVGKSVLKGVALSALAVGVASTVMASKYQSQMTLLQTAAGESHKNMAVVSSGILNLAGATGTSITQLSEGMYTVEKAGIRGAQGLMVLRAAAEGAKAENVDLGTATNALTSVMMSYHLKAKDAVNVQNELVAGSGMAKTTMAAYAGSLASVIPVASAAGIQFDQVGGAIATLTQHGTSAQESTQELANTIRNLQAPSQVSQKAMQQLGLDVNDVSTKLGSRGLTGTIDLITKAITSKMGPSGLVFVDAMKKSQSASADMQTMLKKMPSDLQSLSQKFMSGQIGMKEYQKSFKNMGGTGYAMGSQFLSLSKQTQGFNDLLKSGQPGAQTFSKYLKDIMGGATGMNTALMLGGENMGYFKKATDDVSAASKKGGANISTWPKTLQNLSVQVSQAVQGLAAMGVTIGTFLIPIVSSAVKTGMQWANYLSKNTPLLIAIASVIGGVLVAAMSVYIAHLILAGIKTVAEFAKMVASVVVWSATHVASMVKATAAGAVWLAKSIAQFVAWSAKQAVVLAQGIVLWARYGAMLLAEAVPKFVAALSAMAAQTVSWVATTGVQLLASGAKWVAATAKTVAALAVQNAAMIGQKAVLIGGAVALGVVTAAQWLWNAAMDAGPIGIIILAIAALVATIIWLVANWKGVSAVISTVWNAIVGFFQTAIANVINFVKAHWGLLLSFLIGPIGLAIQWIVDNWSGILGFFQSVGKAIMSWWSSFWNGIVNFGVSIFQGYINWARSILTGFISLFVTVGRTISSVWNGLWTGLGNIVRGAFNGVVGFVRGIFNGIIDLINGVIHSINGALSVGKAIGINVQLGTIPHFAAGGVKQGDGLALVGENGPELVRLPGGSRVYPNGSKPEAATAASSSKSVSMVNNFNTNASPTRIAAEIGWTLRALA